MPLCLPVRSPAAPALRRRPRLTRAVVAGFAALPAAHADSWARFCGYV